MIKDEIYSFCLKNNRNITAAAVVLENTLARIYENQGHPQEIRELTSEAAAVTAAVAGTTGFQGVMMIDIHSDGPVYDLNAAVTSTGKISAFVDYNVAAKLDGKIPELFANGFFTVVVSDESASDQMTRRCVDLNWPTFADCVMNGVRILGGGEVAVKCAVSADGMKAVCVALRRVISADEEDLGEHDPDEDELWREAVVAMASIDRDDMLILCPEEFLNRSMGGLRVRVSEPQDIDFWDRRTEAES